ncbi:DprA-like DNA recombination-mediator protein [Klebsiella phage KpLz-2_45]|uniref:DprA-like DNA recombination-mediator protein n=1 Tax=Klebsiella phage KpLz-2_45 TaxID=2698923 RepID=UPI001F1353D1|nr:DprA-like DNA recombination-mediator protein [Klebsiella phage KpLz-2_45]UKS72190.1 hypothetical protein KpLz245_3240 [Klebsiella phage KpLz-2_45]
MEKTEFAYVTTIGSTDLGQAHFSFCKELGFFLCEQGFSIRSGKAPGADQAFQSGFENSLSAADYIRDPQIFLPWKTFERDNVFVSDRYDRYDYSPESIAKAEAIISTVHPVWDRLTDGQKRFHIRNVFQILGEDVESPSAFLIACAPEDSEGLPKGGTRSAFKIARDRDIPCINIYDLSHQIVFDWLEKTMGSSR